MTKLLSENLTEEKEDFERRINYLEELGDVKFNVPCFKCFLTYYIASLLKVFRSSIKDIIFSCTFCNYMRSKVTRSCV